MPAAEVAGTVVVRHRLVRAAGHPDGIGVGAAGAVVPAKEWSREASAQGTAVAAATVIHRSA